MKKLIFFMTFLIFTRIGMGLGISAGPVGIGNFFLGAPSITESNLNQVLGLLVGADGQPGAAGVSGANGLNGLNGTPGVPGSQGLPGIQGAKGDPGTPGTPGIPGKDGGIGSVGLGGGEVAIGTCDEFVNLSVTQAFTGSGFKLSTVSVKSVDGDRCKGFEATLHINTKSGDFQCSKTIAPDQTQIDFVIDFKLPDFIANGCGTFPNSPVYMDAIEDNIGLEFTKPI
jgi:hypothetical protein